MAKNVTGKSGMGLFIGIIIVILILGVLSTGLFQDLLHPQSEKTTREVALSCTTDMATQFHIHPELELMIEGEKMTLPANIGIVPLCMHPIHTHDATGVIHVESPEKRDFTLGDFFAVWEKPFSPTELMGYKTDATHELLMTVDGATSTAFGDLVLADKQKIRLEYRKK